MKLLVAAALWLRVAAPLGAVADEALRWRVEDQAGKLAATFPIGVSWLGQAPAVVTYWDAKGSERSTTLGAAAGWAFESQALPHGERLVCRHAELGFTIRIEFTSVEQTLTVRAPAAGIEETGSARLKVLRLLPRFGSAAEGEEGYLVLAQQSGVLCHFRGKAAGENWVTVYHNISDCPMPLFGIVRGGGALAAIVTSGECDARFGLSTNFGNDHQYAIDPAFTLRSFAAENRLSDDLAVEYHFLSGPAADWLGVAKTYRTFAWPARKVVPLRQRAANSPGLAYSARAMQVRIRLGVKPVPCEVLEQTPENEPSLRVFCTFARVRDIFDEFHRQGIARAEFCLVGWNRGGHDGRFPQVFPVEPALGGEQELRKTIRHGQALGYQVVAHDCYYDTYHISEDWNDGAETRKDKDGKPVKGGAWGGGQSYNLCLARADELFAPRNFARMRELGFQGAHYSDVLSIIGPRACYDPKHPLTRRQDAEAAARILAKARAVFGASQSEGPLDFTAGSLDRLLYIDWEKWAPLTKRPYFDGYVPLFETVYHGALIYNRSAEAVNSLPGERGYLQDIEFGGTPLTYFYGHFILDPKKNWLGARDYRYDDAEGLRQTVAGIRRVYDDQQRLAPLLYETIEDHRMLAAEVFQTRYGNGQRIVVNYRLEPYTLATGEVVPAQAYVLLGPAAE